MDKKFAKDLKKFSLISNIAFNVISTIFLGVGLGLLLDYLFEKEYCSDFILHENRAVFNKSEIKINK